ncbi:3'-5' exonuclease [Acanthamoeba polyphaga mimivirus]|nr:3'-5' exonuclease [Acanthamoeba castellanii mamavirus]EJN40867.1 hypothetical protein lvs_R363 [Acanthamoeba polyphaga lentillevirus]UMZ08051.1 3'-5' exonuclease [Acanthamoeba polyphaga mimivirus]
MEQEIISAVQDIIDFINTRGSTKVFVIDSYFKNNRSITPVWTKNDLSLVAFIKKFTEYFIIGTDLIVSHKNIPIDFQTIIQSWNLVEDDFALTEKIVGKKLTMFELPNNLDIIVTSDFQIVDNWIENNVYNLKQEIIGLDTETLISEKSEKISIIQLSTSKHNIIIQVNQMNTLPQNLNKVFFDESIIKVGVAIDIDAKKLLQYFPTINQIKKTLDLSDLFKQTNFTKHISINPKESIGLKILAAHVLDLYIENKGDSEIKKSNWNNPVLTSDQVKYAITDSYLSLMIYNELQLMTNNLDVKNLLKNFCHIDESSVKKNSKNNLTRRELEQKEQERRLKSIESKIKKWLKEDDSLTFEFESMNAFYRRHVHTFVEKIPELSSETKGTDPNKYVIITRHC